MMIDFLGGDSFDRISLDPAIPDTYVELRDFRPSCKAFDRKLLWFKGGGSSDNVDEAYNARMATIAEAQQQMAEGYYRYWLQSYQPMEQAQIKANMELIPSETALSLAQNEANLSLLPTQTELSQASNEAALSLLPGQTELTKAQTQYGIDSINAKTPIMNAFYNESLNGVDVDKRANQAAADAAQAFAGSTAKASRNAARMGINPTSGRFASTLNNNSIDRAKAISSAKTNARTNAETENYNRLFSAMGL